MTRKFTLFLVCAFEIALILFVAAWTARADWPKEIMDIQLGQPCSKNITKENNQTSARAICTRYGKQKIKVIFVCLKTISFDALKSKIERDFDTTNWACFLESSGSSLTNWPSRVIPSRCGGGVNLDKLATMKVPHGNSKEFLKINR
jgi:hypothetical protein